MVGEPTEKDEEDELRHQPMGEKEEDEPVQTRMRPGAAPNVTPEVEYRIAALCDDAD